MQKALKFLCSLTLVAIYSIQAQGQPTDEEKPKQVIGLNLSTTAPPKTLDLIKGQRLSITSKTSITVSFKNTDGKPGEVLTKQRKNGPVQPTPGAASLENYDSERVGTGELTITFKDSEGKETNTVKVKVTVK